MQVEVLEAKNGLSRLIKCAQSGEDVVIADGGKPVARLVAVDNASSATSVLGNGRSIIEWIENNPLPPHLQRTAEEIDATIAAERASWD